MARKSTSYGVTSSTIQSSIRRRTNNNNKSNTRRTKHKTRTNRRSRGAGFTEVAETTQTINPRTLSREIHNSLENNTNGMKSNRLDGEERSIREAESGITQNGQNVEGRILIGLDDNGELVIEDGRHLLEAYRRLDKEIPINKISFRNNAARAAFNKKI